MQVVSKKDEPNLQQNVEHVDDVKNKDVRSNERKGSGGKFRKRLVSIHKFFKYFYIEQKYTQWQSLIGPGDVESNDSSITHLWYIFILSFIPVCSFLASSGLIKPYLANDNAEWGCGKITCELLIVLFVTYRIGFAVSLFFLFTTLLLFSISKDGKKNTSTLHTGFWVEKIIIVLLLSCIAFSFPPRVFDEIWHYFLLIGDIIISCLQMFLLCDMVKYVEGVTRAFINENKASTLRICLIIFVQIAVPLIFIFIFYSLSVYQISKVKRNCSISTGVMAGNLVFVVTLVLYTIICRHRHILCTLYVIAFDLFLIFKSSSYATSYCQVDKHKASESLFNPNTALSALLLYSTLIYALVRVHRPNDFYYFYWLLSKENDIFISTAVKHSEGKLRKKTTKERKGSKEKLLNPNETLLEFSFEGSGESESEEQCKSGKLTKKSEKKNAVICEHLSVYYSESFIHGLLFLVSLKATVTVTDYKVLNERNYERSITNPLASLITLHITSFIVLLLYAWYVHVFYTESRGNPHSVGFLIKSMIGSIANAFYMLFVKFPEFVGKGYTVRYIYLSLYSFSSVFACVLLMPYFQHFFRHKMLFCDHNLSFMMCMFQHPTFLGLYRTLASTATFFLLLCVLLINVNTRTSRRNVIQNGCWLSKIILMGLLYFCYFKLPSKVSKIWIYIGLLSTFWFTMVQLFCLIDAMGIVHKSWNHTKSSKRIYVSSTSFASLLYALSAAAFVCFYIYFTQSTSCKVNRMFVSINLVLCIASTIISIHPIVKSGGLLRSAVVTSFCMYLTWSALNYDPNEKCNPMTESMLLMEFDSSGNIAPVIDIFCLTICLFYFIFRINNIILNLKQMLPFFLLRCKATCHDSVNPFSRDTHTTVIETMNDNFQNGVETKYIEKWLSECKDSSQIYPDQTMDTSLKGRLLFGNNDCTPDNISRPKSPTPVENDTSVSYCYSCLHFVLFMATSYLLVLLTHWIEPLPGSDFRVSLQWALMSVKMFASSTCVLSYIWLLIEPVIENLYT